MRSTLTNKSLTYRKKSIDTESTKEPKINQLLINQKKFNDIVLQKIEENSNLLKEVLKKFSSRISLPNFTTFPRRSFTRLLTSFDDIKKMIDSFNNKVISATYRSSQFTRSSKLSEIFKMTSAKSTLTRDDFTPILLADELKLPEKITIDVSIGEISPNLEFDSFYYTAVSCSDAKPPQELTIKTYFGYHMDDPEHVRYTQKSKEIHLFILF